jgi:hypothetical protein
MPPTSAAARPIHHRRGVTDQRPHARMLHHVPSILTGVSMMSLFGTVSLYLVNLSLG